MPWLQSLAVTLLAAAAGLEALAALELPDQRGGADSLAAHRGQPVLVVVVDARRLGTVRRWERDLLERFPGLHVLTVADVNESRPTTVERVAEVLARRVPAEVPVLIDIERRWAVGLGLDTAAPNLLLVDARGAEAARFRGRHSEQLAAVVAGHIAQLRAGT
jgi:hypothetical protein